MKSRVTATLMIASLLLGGAVLAQSTPVSDEELARLRRNIVSEQPETTVREVDRERLSVRRVDIVDANGVIRMTLAGDTPNPVVDGIQYRRSAPVGGLVFFDEKGNERGGLGFNSANRSALFAMDYAAHDAVGVIAREDGTTEIIMNARGPERRHSEFGDRRLPLSQGTTRLRMGLSPDGTPRLALADSQERPRVRLTVTAEGYGAIEFLDGDGKIVSTIAPEKERAERR